MKLLKSRSFRFISLLAALIACASFLFTQEQTLGIVGVLSVMAVVVILLRRGFASYNPNMSASEFFGGTSSSTPETAIDALGTSWVMLGNVVVAGMFLGQIFGVWASWVVVTWFFAFILMSKRVTKVRGALWPKDTLHTFLNRTYQSNLMRNVAAGITIFVGFGVFSAELIAGIALLIAVLPQDTAGVSAPLLILLLVIAMSAAAMAGGLPAVVKTDAAFWWFVVLGTLLLLGFAVSTSTVPETKHEPMQWVPKALDVWGILAFGVGVAALQVPLLLGDYGTWQRIKTTDIYRAESLVRPTQKQAVWQAILWGIPIFAGMAIWTVPLIDDKLSGNVYASSSPLIETVRHWIADDWVSFVIADDQTSFALRVVMLMLFLVGMLAVMVSTANTYLLVAMETWVRDFLVPTSVDNVSASGEASGTDHLEELEIVRSARLVCIVLAAVACIPMFVLVKSGNNLISFIIIVFSVQVALAPPAALALYHPDEASKFATPVVWSVIGGFTSAILFGLIVSVGAFGVWWKDYGTFLTAAIALGIPTLTIVFCLSWSKEGRKKSRQFLFQLLIPL